MERIVEAIVNTFIRELGSDLEAAYLFGSMATRIFELGESNINLLLIVNDRVSMHTIRQIFQPLWQEHGRRLRRAPFIATRMALNRHMMLYPTLAHHLAQYGKPIRETSSLLGRLPNLPELTTQDTYARLSAEVMLASGAVAPEFWPPDIAQSNLLRLRSVARRILQEPLNPRDTAVSIFCRIHERIDPEISALPTDNPWTAMRTATSPLVPGLQATYTKDLDKIVLVFNQLSTLQIQSISWAKLAQRLAKDYKGLYITASPQLRLIHEIETPLDLDFRRSKRTWGMDPLAELKSPTWRKLRQSARFPSDIQIDSLPNAYLTQGDDQVHIIIHDFQNKLLNIQLESELLGRMQLLEKLKPPMPLPGREAPDLERIDAIFQHVGWWADHFTKEMLKAKKNES